MTTIRDYDAERDATALRGLFIELHEAERAIDPRMRPSEEVADEYLDRTFERCARFDGIIFVAEQVAEHAVDRYGIAGYVCVWRRYVSDELDDPPGEMGYVSDLVVTDSARGSGVGRALLRAAEATVREAGINTLRLSVLAGNRNAIALYEDEGFTPVEMDLEKRLDR